MSERVIHMMADLTKELAIVTDTIGKINQREADVMYRENKVQERERGADERTRQLDERDVKVTGREKAVASVSKLLTEARTSLKTERDDNSRIQAKLDTARKELGEAKTRLSAIDAAFPGIARK